jgi:hypothetical protein
VKNVLCNSSAVSVQIEPPKSEREDSNDRTANASEGVVRFESERIPYAQQSRSSRAPCSAAICDFRTSPPGPAHDTATLILLREVAGCSVAALSASYLLLYSKELKPPKCACPWAKREPCGLVGSSPSKLRPPTYFECGHAQERSSAKKILIQIEPPISFTGKL